ncbi:MAG: tail fiber domain-containing protein [Melioribacteraceae bacterium]
MSRSIYTTLVFLLCSLVFSSTFAQEVDEKQNNALKKSRGIDEVQVVGDKIVFKDGATILMEIRNLDVDGGGIYLPPGGTGFPAFMLHSTPAGDLFWNGSKLSLAGSSDNGWTISGNNIYNANSGNVGIGTTSPTALLNVGDASPSSIDGAALIVNFASIISSATISGPTTAVGVFGSSSIPFTSQPVFNYGGYFISDNIGVFGKVSGNEIGSGVSGQVKIGNGVRGFATEGGNVTNYGGKFLANGDIGRAVYGEALSIANTSNYGGYFNAKGGTGRGVYGWASGAIGINYGGEFLADGIGGYGVKGVASDLTAINYGGYFESKGKSGYGVYAVAEDASTGVFQGNTGGYFQANAEEGRGVVGVATSSGTLENVGGSFQANGEAGIGVRGHAGTTTGTNYGGSFEAKGTTGYGVYAKAPLTGWAGYFDGNVFIGSATPAAPQASLHIKQLASVNAIRMEYDSDTDFWDTYIDGANDYNFSYNGLLRAYIQPGTGAFVITSDERLKNNIQEINGVLSSVLSLKPKRYVYNDDKTNREQIGFVAQDVEKLFPEAVSEKNGYKGVNYAVFGVLAIEAIKEQQTKIDALEKRLARLEGQMK